MSKRKRDEEGLDFGLSVDEQTEEDNDKESTEETSLTEDRIEDAGCQVHLDMNRVVEDDDEVRYKGTVNEEDLPVCPCCEERWSIQEGTLIIPGCGCAIHPICHKCGSCEAHCQGHRK